MKSVLSFQNTDGDTDVCWMESSRKLEHIMHVPKIKGTIIICVGLCINLVRLTRCSPSALQLRYSKLLSADLEGIQYFFPKWQMHHIMLSGCDQLEPFLVGKECFKI
jgi:hypothetical protein